MSGSLKAQITKLNTLTAANFTNTLTPLLSKILQTLATHGPAFSALEGPLKKLQQDASTLKCLQNHLNTQIERMAEENARKTCLEQAHRDIDIAGLNACIQAFEATEPEQACEQNRSMDNDLLAALPRLQEWHRMLRKRIASQEETLARIELQQRLHSCDTYNQKLTDIQGRSTFESEDARHARKKTRQVLQRIKDNIAQYDSLYRDIAKYQDYQSLQSRFDKVQSTFSQYNTAIQPLNATLPAPMPVEDVQPPSWQSYIKNTPMRPYLASIDQAWIQDSFQKTQSAAFSLGHNLMTGFYTFAGCLPQNNPQTGSIFSFPAFSGDKDAQRKLLETELSRLRSEMDAYTNVPDAQTIIQKAQAMRTTFDVSAANLQNAALLAQVASSRQQLQEAAEKNTSKLALLEALLPEWEAIETLRRAYHFTQDNAFYRHQKLKTDEAGLSEALAFNYRQLNPLHTLLKKLKTYQEAKIALNAWKEQQQDICSIPEEAMKKRISALRLQIQAGIHAVHTMLPRLEALLEWKNKIDALACTAPETIQAWLHCVAVNMQEESADTQSWWQCQQLMRDIQQELEYSTAEGSYALLSAYQNLAPNPKTQLNALLCLKPGIPPVENQSLPPLQHPELQNALAELKRYTDKLQKESYEARLLRQVCQNLHYIGLQAERNPQFQMPKNLSHLAEDPRYDCLRQHHGIGKAWELLVKAWCKLLDTLQADKTHRCRDSFFYHPSKMERLLDTAIEQTRVLAAG